ncbi:MAG: protein phosphatase 2C domain-containing protein [Verrucomicrobia bacterium]|nr:protein phosphatase 2C domain-containing protein [Verrucomicrobiota bacterium]
MCGAFFGQLGDGAWILTYGPSLIAATWPLRGTYANETSFLTSQGWSTECEFAKFVGPIESVAGAQLQGTHAYHDEYRSAEVPAGTSC